MLKISDLRKTTRRTSVEGVRSVHPRLLRDRSLAPRIDLAIRYLDGMLGQPRRALDQETIIQLFGDHKIARCIVECLATSYRHRARRLDEVLAPPAVAALQQHAITTPVDARLWLYRRANAIGYGFVGATERPPFLATASAALGIAPDELQTLLALDAPENAILTRYGATPSAADVIARYNFEVLAALLANAQVVRLTLTGPHLTGDQRAALETLAEPLGVQIDVGAREVTLHGRQDLLGGWSRHGVAVVRLLATMLVCGVHVRSGEALIAVPAGATWRLRLDDDALADLGAPRADHPAQHTLAGTLAAYRSAMLLANDAPALRRSGRLDGWAFRRARGPLVVEGAVLPSLLTAQHSSGEHVHVIALPDAVATDRDMLAAYAGPVPIAFLAAPDAAARVPTSLGVDAPPVLTYARQDDAPALACALGDALSGMRGRAARGRIAALLDEVRAHGVVAESRLARRLGCSEEDILARLAEPEVLDVLDAAAVEYIEGFGLCARDTINRARDVTRDVAALQNSPSVGQAWVVRVLGRKLREVTGSSEGIECLIAYLGAA